MDWQPIETAPLPRDDGSYLVADMSRGFVAPIVRGVIMNNPGTSNDWEWGDNVTHWMPLPNPPTYTKQPD